MITSVSDNNSDDLPRISIYVIMFHMFLWQHDPAYMIQFRNTFSRGVRFRIQINLQQVYDFVHWNAPGQ
jgi:hypothetical protein